MGLFALGFNRFSQINSIKTNVVSNPTQIDPNIVSVVTSTRNLVVLKKCDGTSILKGFWNGNTGCEINITRNIKCGTLLNDKLYLIDNVGSLFEYQDKEQFLKMASPHNIKEVCSTESSPCLFGITESGVLYRWNEDKIPIEITLPYKISQIGCGINHVLACTDSGNVYSWGTGSRGQLGHSCLEDSEKPKLIEMLCGVIIKSVAAGGWHSLSLSDTGDIYVWGWNEVGQLGYAAKSCETAQEDCKPVAMMSTPALLELEKYLKSRDYLTIVSISCGARHSAAVSSQGSAITWGWGKYGQLGQNCCITKFNDQHEQEKRIRIDRDCEDKPHVPGLVEFPTMNRHLQISSVKCGPWNTFFKEKCS